MLGKRRRHANLFDVGYVFDLPLDPDSFYGQLARAAPQLFQDADFAKLYDPRRGRPSVPPSQLALLLLLQHYTSVSDEEALQRSSYDVRWAVILGCHLGTPLCATSTLELFRSKLILHQAYGKLFERSLAVAREQGLLTGPLRIAIDTKPILGRGAVEDTYNLLARGIKQLCQVWGRTASTRPEAWAAEHDLGRYFTGSIKGQGEVDWSDAAQRRAFLQEIVTDARRLLRYTTTAVEPLAAAPRERLQAAAQLLTDLLAQDVEETPGADGAPQASLREGTTPGRKPSATDEEQRHGRKSKSRRFDGHKASIATAVGSKIVVGAEVLAGDAPDDTDLLAQVSAVEAATGLPVETTLGDCAYGSGARRAEFAEAERELVAKVGQETPNRGRFTKSQFVVVWGTDAATSVQCPAGQSTTHFTREQKRGQVFQFGHRCDGCPLRAQCTSPTRGRTVRVHPQEPLLQAARALQGTPAGRQLLRERVGVEHALARLARLGIGQARYRGREKTRFQLQMAATVANLRRTWNWAAEKLAQEACATPFWGARPASSAAPAGFSPRWWRVLVLGITVR